MAKHEGMHAKDLKEHERKRGGKMPETEEEEAREEEKEAEEGHEESPGRKRGGRTKARKNGGKIEGEKPAHRPDKRARGGATSDENPFSAAGKVSSLPFERVGEKPDGGGKGKDRD